MSSKGTLNVLLSTVPAGDAGRCYGAEVLHTRFRITAVRIVDSRRRFTGTPRDPGASASTRPLTLTSESMREAPLVLGSSKGFPTRIVRHELMLRIEADRVQPVMMSIMRAPEVSVVRVWAGIPHEKQGTWRSPFPLC